MSKLFTLNTQDLIKGLLIAILSAVISYAGNITTLTSIDPKTILQIAIISAISYLAKNLATNSEGKFLGSEK